MQLFRGGLLFKAQRLCVSLNSRLESNNEEKVGGQLAETLCAGQGGDVPPQRGAFLLGMGARLAKGRERGPFAKGHGFAQGPFSFLPLFFFITLQRRVE